MAGGWSVQGRVAVVTGAARGLGAEMAVRLAARGAKVALLGLEPEGLAAVAAKCGPDAAWWEVDVTDSAALARVAGEVEQRLGAADVLVANAGIAVAASLLVGEPESYDRVIEVNLLGSVRTARAFLPQLVRTKGYLLQIASLAAMAPVPMMSAYCASKSGVEAFAQALRGELTPHGVGVGVAYLTWTDTDMVRGGQEKVALGGRRMPGPLGRTYPAGPAADRLVAGIEKRSWHVFAPAWVGVMMPLRALLPLVLPLGAKRTVRETEATLRAAGPDATRPVGPGGEADSAVRASAPGPRPSANGAGSTTESRAG
jgi:NAD(P)-dependent dehydrogenase (short-subunit alcohol dehydrogenase family)